MPKTKRTGKRILRHPLFLRILQAFCIFEPVPTEAASQASTLAKAPRLDAAGHRKETSPKATTKLDIGGVI